MRDYNELGTDAVVFIQQSQDSDAVKKFEKIARNISEKDVEYVEQNFWAKISRLKSRIDFKRDLIALYKFMKDPAVSFLRKAIAIAALVYFILPLDSIPDLSPLIGLIDDLGIITMVVKFLSKELERYY
ncbi:MAG: YkvA family protein [Candidatus Kryptonium sp.]|nr:YkvA family protein [Candidatus Kryptonium sp.]